MTTRTGNSYRVSTEWLLDIARKCINAAITPSLADSVLLKDIGTCLRQEAERISLQFVEDDINLQDSLVCKVWISEPDDDGNWEWTWMASYYEDELEPAKQLRKDAHEHARWLRANYPCALVAVRNDDAEPLPPRFDD